MGHVRNMLLGNSIAALLEKSGHKVKKIEIVNDRGIHICKSMLAYKLFGDNQEPDKKTDHYVRDWYVRFAKEAANNESLNEQAQDMLKARENYDEEVRTLRKTMNDWAES